MARIRNGILGGFNGKVGEVIGQNYAGVSIIRAMPKYVSNPRTAAQQAHRKLFKAAVDLFSPCAEVLKYSSWNVSAVNNGFNNAVRRNFDKFALDNNDDLDVDLFGCEFGEFYSPGLNVSQAQGAWSGSFMDFTIEYDNKPFNEFCHDEDWVILIVAMEVAPNQYRIVYSGLPGAQRVDGSCMVTFEVGSSVEVGTNFYYAATTCYTGHGPQSPRKVIQIPAKRVVKFSSDKSVQKS